LLSAITKKKKKKGGMCVINGDCTKVREEEKKETHQTLEIGVKSLKETKTSRGLVKEAQKVN